MVALQFLVCFLRQRFRSDVENALELVAMRSQLALFYTQIVDGKLPKPQSTMQFRRLWIFLSQKFDGWKDALMLVKPETVLKWHERSFKAL